MDINAYLEEILSIDLKIANKMYEVEMWRDIAQGSTASSDGERVQSSGSQQKMANAVVKYTDAEHEIEKLNYKKWLFIQRIERMKKDYYQFMHDMYIKQMSLKEIQRAQRKSDTWATSKHYMAKKMLKEIIEGEGHEQG